MSDFYILCKIGFQRAWSGKNLYVYIFGRKHIREPYDQCFDSSYL